MILDFFRHSNILYFAEHEEKMNAMQAEVGSPLDFYKDILNFIVYYIPLNLKILKPWIFHYFLNQHNIVALCVLTIMIMILSASYIWNNFAWEIFTTLLSLHFKFWITWLGEILAYLKK